ncbi:hypothetical protein ABPG73_011690 [Tetrahymena malaccensis]
MILIKIFFSYFVQSLYILKVYAELQQQNVKFAYSQTYTSRFDISNPDGAYTKIKTAKNANLIFASAGLEGILIVDAKTNKDFARFDFKLYINTLEVTSDGNFIFLSFNNTVSVASFFSRSSIQILSQSNFHTNITDMVLDKYEQILYAVGVGGYVIAYDVKNKNQINQLSAFDTNSITIHTVKVSPDNKWLILANDQDNYFFVAQYESGMVSLIDASDKHNLLLISQFQYQNRQSAQSLCLTLDQQSIFINNNLGTLVMPLQSQIMLHTDFSLVTVNSSGYTNQTRYQSNQFQVGQQIKMDFVMLYPIEGAQIVGAQYYLNYIVQDLPSWIQFDAINENIFMIIDKQALGTQFNGTNLNMILLKIALPINQSQFIFDLDDGSSTSASDSAEIFRTLRQQGIITNSGFVSDNFDYTLDLLIKINETLLSTSLQNSIRQQLQSSVFINQILFNVSSSLQLDLNKAANPVSSLSESIEIEFLVNLGQGKFILEGYQGVVISSSTEQNQIILKGSLISINYALQQKIVFFSLIDPLQIYVTITLSDDINYSQTQIYKVSECPIIRQKSKLSSNANTTLQAQFNQKYVDGIISIQQLFSIDFVIGSFVDEENSQIQLKAYVVDGDLQKEIQIDSWVQFRVNTGYFSFEGTPSSSQLFSVVHIRVIADDGYSQAQGEFTIIIKDIPFTYILNIILQVLGPLLALLKVYYSRYIFLNCIYKSKVTFSDEKIKVGKLFFKKFIIMGDEMQKCIYLFQGFIQEENKKLKGSFSPSRILSPQLELQKSNTQNTQKLTEIELKQEQQSHNSYQLRKYSKVVSEYLNNPNQSINLHYSSLSEDQFIQNQQREINMENVFDQINKSQISFKIGGKKYSPELFQLDFKNPNSRVYKGLESLAARYFLKKDQKSYHVYKYLKLYSIEYSRYNKNDWYKQYVNIYQNQNKDIYGIQIPFPTLSLQEQAINLALKKLNSKTTISISSAQNCGINFNLIKMVLYSDVLGLVNYVPNSLQPCKGISIHLHSYEIKAVQTYKLVHGRRFSYLRKLLNIEYNEYGTSKNRSLPSWLELEHNNGIIQLTGIPMSQDAENIFLRIINSKDYVIQQFSLHIAQQAINYRNLPQNTQQETLNQNNISIYEEASNQRHHTTKNNSFYLKNNEKSSFLRQQQQIFNSSITSESPIYQFRHQSSLPIDVKDESFMISNNDQQQDQEYIIKKSNFANQVNRDKQQPTQNIFQHLISKQQENDQSKQLIKSKQTIPLNLSNQKSFNNESNESSNQNQNSIKPLSNFDLNQLNEDACIPGIRLFKYQQENNKDKNFQKGVQKNKTQE